ncbi:two-component system nitrogen regulation sensor histidine kinase NtrY [Sphingomonas sp. BE138]|uniref:sensor histidine kinase n=1 Tax=Sphingomonas sp. BE138 TaxID=2817845 RepID=UPI0028614E1D|nr:ATP-binding protein [Sphingomonas sp. BE138]MDR6788567.1 two-component system nitrogen regulation sensor histidine kinase NtrY [Sphingomonas sp. BE138]
MFAGVTSSSSSLPGLRRRVGVTPAIELMVLAAAVAVAVGSYFALRGEGDPGRLLAPPLVASLLVANLVTGIALMMLLGRRIALSRAARSPVGAGGRLHVRLVLLFSLVAAVPALLVTIFASLLFQYGVQFWYSDRARGMFENAASLAQESYRTEQDRVTGAARAMSGDLAEYLRESPIDSRRFTEGLFYQLYLRNLSEALIVQRGTDGELRTLALVNPYDRALDRVVTAPLLRKLRTGEAVVPVPASDRLGALTPLDYAPGTYLYVARVFEPQLQATITRGDAVLNDYRQLIVRARSLQLRFNAALLIVSLLIVGVAVWIALTVADRLVRPVGELVDAARRVEGGDFSARVPETLERDEIGTLSNAFNSMTARLVAQNAALDSRRALIEAVMSGVSAGVISIDAKDRTIRLINSSAQTLMGLAEPPVGRKLHDVAPELDGLLDQPGREAGVQLAVQGEMRTFAVRIARDGSGPIITFDDITQQLTDQRRAAWADVARRIAHEIKNPLTPIQLAAERLQRRYGSKIDASDTTFARLTDTIVRQVGDLRRMVDEFSSFARMPKPVFREESLVDIARQTMFLHEVAHPGIHFVLDHDDPAPSLVCDRRQLGQALTNIVKNAVEAVEEADASEGSITMTLGGDEGRVTIAVADSGVGLPLERDRIVEPYMTTRARGTGLGLAIVKKIVEEHFGTMTFADRPGGGTIVTLSFDTAPLAALASDDHSPSQDDDRTIAALTRNRI